MECIVYIKAYNSPKIDKNEILRYAKGVGDGERLSATLDACIAEAEKLLSYKVCYSRYPVAVNGDTVDLGFARVNSRSLAACLSGCSEAILFCATVGHGIDRLIAKYSAISPSRAVLLQAMGSERVEALCDAFCADIAAEEAERGCKTKPRFSPGYGDLPLSLQRDIFARLDCPRKIGVTLGGDLFMSPSKSVTAIIGIKKEV